MSMECDQKASPFHTNTHSVTATSCGGPICFASRIDGIPPITGGDQAPLLERLVDCMSGTVSLNEGGSGRTRE